MKRRRKLAYAALALFFSLLLLWLALEAAFRVFPNRYQRLVRPHMETWHKPGSVHVYEGAALEEKQPFSVLVRWNERGWHDREHAFFKPPGTKRILVLGDSYIEGVQVEEDALFHERIARALSRKDAPVEAIAIASSGWGQVQEKDALEREGLSYSPDLVLLEFLPRNDVRNNQDELERLATEETARSSFARRLFFHAMSRGLYFSSFLLDQTDLALRRLRGEKDPVDTDVYRETPRANGPLWQDAWLRTEELVKEIHALSRERRAELVVVIFEAKEEIEAIASPERAKESLPPEVDVRLPGRRMAEICRRDGIPCLDLAPRFALLAPPERASLHLANDGHWTARGHEVAALETVRFLAEEKR